MNYSEFTNSSENKQIDIGIDDHKVTDKITDPINFISAGIACFAISLLENFQILKLLYQGDSFDDDFVETLPKPLVIHSAISILIRHDILLKRNNLYVLTEFGEKLLDHLGSIGLIYSGYSSVLANQEILANYNSLNPSSFINGKAVANASVHFGEKYIDPLVISEIMELNIKGTICDLGCGTGKKLIKMCRAKGINGLGVELNKKAIDMANKNIEKYTDLNIAFKNSSLSDLNFIDHDVELITQFFVMHDIDQEAVCVNIINSFKNSFPNLKYFIYTDVTSSSSDSHFLPGFEYVHSLLGIKPRSQKATVKMLERTFFKIIKQIEIPELPCTYIWILEAV